MKWIYTSLIMMASAAAAAEHPRVMLSFEPATARRDYAFIIALTNVSPQTATVDVFTNAFLGTIHVLKPDGTTLDLFEKYGRLFMLSGEPILVPKTAQAHGEFYRWRIPASELCTRREESVSIADLTGRVAFADLWHVWVHGEPSGTNVVSDNIRIRIEPSAAANAASPRR